MAKFKAVIFVKGDQESWMIIGENAFVFESIKRKAARRLPGFCDILAKNKGNSTMLALVNGRGEPLAMGHVLPC